jgi:hypothetical protein
MKHLLLALCGLSGFLAAAQTNDFVAEIAKHREEYKQNFLLDQRAPLKEAELPFLRFFDADIKYRVKCEFTRTPQEKPFDLPTYSGITRLYVKYGYLTFGIDGEIHNLSVYKNLYLNLPKYQNHLFLPFRDITNDEETYGGGRYIDLKIDEVESGNFFLDFNKCYNPWCCYSEGYNCPIPPIENHLEIRIPAGEKMYAGVKKK